MDQFSFVSELLAASDALTPEIVRLNAIILFATALAVVVPLGLRRFLPSRTGMAAAAVR
jgi:hypothetical protein